VVAIRDGKLATETVRQRARVANGDQRVEDNGRSRWKSPAEHEEVLEELTVLDSAGRLQIPKDYLERCEYQIARHAGSDRRWHPHPPGGRRPPLPSAEALGAALAAPSARRRQPRLQPPARAACSTPAVNPGGSNPNEEG
jgi:hypothetical protein